ncbi:MAG: response regulator [Candidatus Acidiferrales bacterium]
MAHLLVVDDDSSLREVIRGLLEVAGFSVTTASNGRAALEQLERGKFDLVVMDVWMPEMTGLEVLEQLRSRADSPKVILLTADDTPETVLRAVREQAYRFLAKPFDPEVLVEVVQSALAASAAPATIEVLSARPNWVELEVPCRIDVVDRLQGFLERLKADLPDEVRAKVGQAFRELLLNAIEWGGQLDPNRKVRIAYLRARRMLLYRIADPGKGFRFEELEHAAVGHAPDQVVEHMRVREEKGIRPGGFGLLLAQVLVDELIYNETQNEVVFIKYLE